MAVFEYVAKDSTGSEFTGVYTDVESTKDLRHELSKMGYSLVKAHCQRKTGGGRKRKVKQADIVAFAFEFAGMYGAGLSIVRCLETFEGQAENSALKSIITDIREHVDTGLSLAEAFEKHRAVFSDFFLGMVEAGEKGGRLAETLQMAADYLEKQSELRNKVRSAFAYPIAVGVMCCLIVTALVIFVIPVFQKLYSQLHIDLPGPTLMLILISEIVRHYWMIAVPAIGITVFLIRRICRNPQVKKKLDSFKLKMPVFGKLNRMVVVSRFIRTFSMMAQAGVTVVEAIELARRVANNYEMEKIADNLKEEVMVGNSLAGPMSKYPLFPSMIVQLTAAGEEAGILPEMLGKGVEFLDSHIERTIQSLINKIEPIMSVLMGAIVGTILLGVYLPMFDYMGHVK
ncbi:MAG: type II secretion system F family protein [Planctomycetes bacterium]|nr:type II secretion system F family protein [Planctomycetota bacterium]